MRGQYALWIIDALPMSRHPETGRTRFCRPRRAATPSASAAFDRKVTDVDDTAPPYEPNIGRYRTGSGVGMDALGSPMAAVTMKPLLMTNSGLTPKKAGFHTTRSASLPASTEPTSAAMPWEIAGLIVYFATYRFARALSCR